jgi:glucose/arabinose dehydrogenase
MGFRFAGTGFGFLVTPSLATLLTVSLGACGGGSGSSSSFEKHRPTPTITPTTVPTPTPTIVATSTPTVTPTATASPTPSPIPPLALAEVATGLSSPVDLQMPTDGTNRFFVVEQAGTIKILRNGAVLSQAFLNIQGKVTSGGELGLLGLAFHPNYSSNGRFFLNYTRTVNGTQRQTVIAEYRVSSSDPNLADPASEKILLTVDQPFDNHNAGQLAFGPDGFLYFGLGDGGNGGDPLGNGQNLATLLGKMMRIDVDHADPGLQYAVPPDNPFVGNAAVRPEIWAYGFRNPWRFSFERGTGRQFCADVGQSSFEEVDLVQKGGNFGWNVMEGAHCFNPPSGCDTSGKILPIAEYDHSEGSAIIGGYVYKGTEIPALTDLYIFGDLSSQTMWYLREAPPGTFTRTTLLSQFGFAISAFGQDTPGEIYVVDYSFGRVLKLVAQ